MCLVCRSGANLGPVQVDNRCMSASQSERKFLAHMLKCSGVWFFLVTEVTFTYKIKQDGVLNVVLSEAR